MTYFLALVRITIVASLAVMGGLPAYNPATSKIDPKDPNLGDVIYLKIDKHKAALLIGLALICVPLEFWSFIRAERRALRKSLKRCCDALHNQFFADKTDQEKVNFRVTLFRVTRHWRTCWQKPCRLVIHARSGHLNLRSGSYFEIDDENPAKNEGFAGRVFAKNCSLAEELPLYDQNPLCEETKRYLTMSNMTHKRVSELNRKSSSFYGTVIRKDGKKWGVLVLDGLEPGSVVVNALKRDMVDTFALSISEMV